MKGASVPDSVSVASPLFNTTHWSVVLQAGKVHSAQSTAALEKLCRAYWYPLYSFIRRKGYGEEDAKDFTQQFFARLLERNDLETIDPAKGRFRTFLLTALTNFLSNEHDRATAQKRGGGNTLLSLDEIDDEHFHRFEAVTDMPPDRLFDVRWATTVMEQALSALQKEMVDAGKAAQFDELKRFLTADAGEGDYAMAGQHLNLSSQAVAVSVFRLRQRFRELVRSEVAHTVSTPLEIDQEMRYLCEILNA
jgi:DNA-directed RNA polymerase specialized sigma24 family protein